MSGGKSKSVVVSYWYALIAHLGLCKGPIDALLEVRGGDRTAWKGRMTASGVFAINKPNLYGGEKSEGGIDGNFELMMGESDQSPNSYMASEFGPQPGYRGRTTILLRGPKIGAGNPYPKALGFKVERIYNGWKDNECWYEEKAAIPMDASITTIPGDASWEYQIVDYIVDSSDPDSITIPNEGWGGPALAPFGRESTSGTLVPEIPINTFWGYNTSLWLRKTLRFDSGSVTVSGYVENAVIAFLDGVMVASVNLDNSQSAEPSGIPYTFEITASTGVHELVLLVLDEHDEDPPPGSLDYGDNTYFYAEITAREVIGDMRAMNPAHIIYDSIISNREDGGMAEPVGRINEASFIAAADRLYSEGFGLCCTWHGGESVEQFQQRICNVIGGSLQQSRKTGQYHLHLLRKVDDPSSLITITDDDITDWDAELAVPSEVVNQMQVHWFDPERREARITTPIQSLGAIQDAGGIYPDEREYYEIPVESLADRVCQRELDAVSSVLWRFTFACTRKAYDLMPGMQIRLLCPKRGFADVVVVIGDIDYGDFKDDDIRIIALQDVFALPDTVTVDPQGTGAPTLQPPQPVTENVVIEAPYVELVTAMTAAELEGLEDDAGYILAGAVRPANGDNYLLAARVSPADYQTYGNGQWMPACSIVAGDTMVDAAPATTFAYEDGSFMDRVTVGSWAKWDNELVRVDAVGTTAETVTLGRGVADAVPTPHAPNSRILFLGDWNSSDFVEHIDGETVQVKLLNRTASDEQALADVTAISVTMDERQARPYPPGQLKIDGAWYPSSVSDEFVVTWAHRNKVMQADQLIDTTANSVTPADNTRYGLRFRRADTNAILVEQTDIGPGTATVNLNYTGDVKLELWTIDNFGVSWTMHSHTFVYTGTVGNTIVADAYTPVDDSTIIDGGDLDG